MKHMPALGSIDLTDRTEPLEPARRGGEPGTPPAWEIEELTEVRESLGSHWANRWLGASIAVAVGIVSFGFAGHWSAGEPVSGQAGQQHPAATVEPHRAPIADPTFVLTTPVDGDTVDGGMVEVRGIARRPLGTVHLAVWLGEAVLGWTNVDVRTAGPISAAIRVFTPSFDVPVVLRIDSGASQLGEGVAITVGLRLQAAPGVSLWRSRLAGPPGSPAVLVEGFGGEATDGLDIRVRTAAGRVVASGTGSIGYEDGRPGALGGRMIGLGSFTVRLTFDEPPPAGALLVTMTWRDHAGGALNETDQIVRKSTKPGALP